VEVERFTGIGDLPASYNNTGLTAGIQRKPAE